MADRQQINRLRVLQGILSQTRDFICETYGISKDEAFNRTQKFIEENSERWRLVDPKINYEDPFCRMAYLYMNVAVHAALVEAAFSSYPQIQKLIKAKADTGSDLHICALGGGPGSELIGVVRYVESLRLRGKTVHLDFALIDRIKEWDESWHALKTGVDRQLRENYGSNRNQWPISISRSFLPLDATVPSDLENFATRFKSTDIFLICYLVSELKGSKAKLENAIKVLLGKASLGTLVLFIDRDEREVRESVQTFIEHNPNLLLLGTRKEKGGMEDNLEDFGEWYIHLPALPRRKWMAFFTLAQTSAQL
jgi:hypothetical protein